MSQVTLPSLLAEGNIPALAREMDLEFIFLTEKRSEGIIRASAAATALEKYCRLRTIYIDDLIVPLYGVVLTNAYFRAVTEDRTSACDFYYFFLNVDSIIADGSYATVLAEIKAGNSLIFAPGIRVDGPKTIKQLKRSGFWSSRVLAAPSRALAAIALENLHVTVRSQRQSHRFVHLDRPYQFYWQQDAATLHMCQFLMANVCFRPTRVPDVAPCYIDYCIAEALAPEMPITVLKDSDEFLLVEPQEPNWMRDEVHAGFPSRRWFIREFSTWMTKQHVELGRTICTVHAAELGPGDEALRGEARTYIEAMAPQIRTNSIHNHRFWKAGVRAYDELQRLKAAGDLPQVQTTATGEDPLIVVDRIDLKPTWRRRLFETVYGGGHRKTIFHPQLLEFREMFGFVESTYEHETILLLPRQVVPLFRYFLKKGARVYEYHDLNGLMTSVAGNGSAVAGKQLLRDLERCDHVLFFGIDGDALRIPEIANWLIDHTRGDCELAIYFRGPEVSYLTRHGEGKLVDLLDIQASHGEVVLAGTLVGLLADRAIAFASKQVARRRYLPLFAAAAIIGLATLLTVPLNVWGSAARRRNGLGVQSLLIKCRTPITRSGAPNMVSPANQAADPGSG